MARECRGAVWWGWGLAADHTPFWVQAHGSLEVHALLFKAVGLKCATVLLGALACIVLLSRQLGPNSYCIYAGTLRGWHRTCPVCRITHGAVIVGIVSLQETHSSSVLALPLFSHAQALSPRHTREYSCQACFPWLLLLKDDVMLSSSDSISPADGVYRAPSTTSTKPTAVAGQKRGSKARLHVLRLVLPSPAG